MNTRYFLSALFVLATGCAASSGAAGDAENTASSEADLAAAAPAITARDGVISSTGLPVMFGLPSLPDGSAVREIVFLETTVPDGPDADGRPRYTEVRYQKRTIRIHAEAPIAEIDTPGGGVANGAMLISSADGKVREAVLATANREIGKLWDTHPTGRFSIKMFPGSATNVVRTANGFTVTMSSNGSLTATDGHGVTYDGDAGLPTLEELTVTTDGEERVSQCRYRLQLKEAAVLANLGSVAVFHVERTLVEKYGDIQCTKQEDRFVLGAPRN